MAFVLLYLQGKMPEKKRKNAPFRLECWGCNLSYGTWKRNFQFQLVWRGMGWWKNLRALLKCKMLPAYGMAQKGNIREDLWLRYSTLPGQNNETLLLRFTSLENRLQTSIKAWKYCRLQLESLVHLFLYKQYRVGVLGRNQRWSVNANAENKYILYCHETPKLQLWKRFYLSSANFLFLFFVFITKYYLRLPTITLQGEVWWGKHEFCWKLLSL